MNTCVICGKETTLKYCAVHTKQEKDAFRMRERRQANPEYFREYQKRFRNNPYNPRRKAVQLVDNRSDFQKMLSKRISSAHALYGISYETYIKKWHEQHGLCAYTQQELEDPQIDHIKPQSKGGSSAYDNWVLVNGWVNRAKWNYSVKQLCAWLGLDYTAVQNRLAKLKVTEY